MSSSTQSSTCITAPGIDKMEIGSASESIVYTMPATRSTNVKRAVKQTSHEKWTQLEERVLIKMTRHHGLSEEEIARSLCRSVPAVRYRLSKIFHEHLDGRTDAESIQEVSDWLLPEHHYT